ncbi:MAG: metallophosphoesterase [Oscillospiraceae bacterium]
MSTYVMSDIHGEYEKYRAMLKSIRFSDKDELFVLGDVADRGEKPISILLDMMNRPNVFPLLGNHDLAAFALLSRLNESISDENTAPQLDRELADELMSWMNDGGEPTITEFRKQDADTREAILEYLEEFTLYEAVDVGDKTFVLVHAGLGNYREGKKLSEYTAEELLFERLDPNRQYFADDSVYLVTGHTPTPYFSGLPEIYKNRNNICIDCGASFKGGRLACLRLEDMAEFYV